MKKHCVLIQAHNNLEYFLEFSKINKNVNFYVHMDKKSNYYYPPKSPDNISFLKNNIDVYWGGWSQVEVTMMLLREALKNKENFYFHICSGEDVFLNSFDRIQNDWNINFNQGMMIESKFDDSNQYRTRFSYPHANTSWQRSILGKILTKLYQYLYKIMPNKYISLSGSSWFSLTHSQATTLTDIVNNYKDKFEKILCPDEHFFQFLANKSDCINTTDNNKRFIVFTKDYENGNSPIYLNIVDLESAKEKGFWIARKVNKEVALTFLKKSQSIDNE